MADGKFSGFADMLACSSAKFVPLPVLRISALRRVAYHCHQSKKDQKLICTECQHKNEPDSRFCVNCGVSFLRKCHSCDATVAEGQNFCGNCGVDLRLEVSRRDVSPASYTPRHLAERILAERHLIVGERKRVTVLFVDIVDSTEALQNADPEDADRYLTDALRGMMDAIHLFEGTVNMLRGDGVMALFGAPIAHEDHAVRAARSALAIPDAVTAATDGNARTRVGLHSGEVLLREVGNDLSIEYQALGPTVHLAARMEEIAEPGKTYITEDVRRLIYGFIDTRHIGPTRLKGFSDPVEVFELSGTVESSPWRARASRGLAAFTGRASEINYLRDLVSDVRRGSGRVVTITGEAGIGKSRLVHEFLTREHLKGFTVLKAEASPFEINTTNFPIKGLLHSWLQLEPDDQQWAARLESAIADLDPSILSYFPVLSALLGEAIADPNWTEQSPEQRKRQLRDAVRSIVASLSVRSPLVIVMEDLHWIDGETQTILDDVVADASGISLLLLLTHRPEYENRWLRFPHVMTRRLEPLRQESALQLLDTLIGSDPSVRALKPQVASRVGGTPLFLEEAVRQLAENGNLDGNPGDYVAAQNELPLEIPHSVQAVLAARIDRLDPADKNVLQIASVAGQPIRERLLCDVIGRSEENIRTVLSRLQAREFLYEEHLLPEVEIRFRHALVREVAYKTLPKSQRKQVHALVVSAIERAANKGSAEQLAFHALRGELWEKAAHYCLLAADRSIDQSAFREAAVFLRDAALSLNHLPQTREVVETSIDLRMRLRVAETGAPGALAKLVKDLEDATDLAVSIGDKSRQAQVMIHLGYVENMLGDNPLATRLAQQSRELALEIEDHYLVVESQILSAQSASYSGRPADVSGLLLPHMDYLTREIRHETMGQTMIRSVVACAHLAVSDSAQNRFESAHMWEQEGSRIADEAHRPFDRMYMQYVRGICLDFQGDIEESVIAHERSVEIAKANDIWFMMTFAQPWHGHALYLAGKYQEALRVLQATRTSAQRTALHYVEALCCGFASQVNIALGDAESARTNANKALAYGQAQGAPLLEFIGLQSLGRADEARAVAEKWNYVVWGEALMLR